MTILKENFFERMENRLAPDRAAAAIAILKKAMARQDISQDVIRDAARLVERYRRCTRSAIQEYRQWQAAKPVTEVLQGLCDQEGRVLLGHARAMSSLYLDALHDYRDLKRLSARKDRKRDQAHSV